MTNPSEHEVSFYVDGDPIPKQSFRVIEKRSGKIHGYADPRVTSWQNAIGTIASTRIDKLFTGKIKVIMEFYLSNNRVVDLDNLCKAVLDGLKGIAFKDDNQVVKLELSKQVDKDDPGVGIFISEVK